MARSLNFTVDREEIDVVIGGEHFPAPALIAPAAIAELLQMQGRLNEAFTALQTTPGVTPSGSAMTDVLTFIADLFDLMFGESEPGVLSDSAVRFRARLLSKTNPFDLVREVVPATRALVEEYTGRPTLPSPPSSTSGGDGVTTSTAGQPGTALTPSASPPDVSAT